MTQKEAFELIYSALRVCTQEDKINDVTREGGEFDTEEIILTTDDGGKLQVWVLRADSLLETDAPLEE